MSVLLNGVSVAGDLALHRGLHYGDGVFRTCMIYDGQVIDLAEQCHKACADAAQLQLIVQQRAVLEREAADLARGQSRAVLKIMLLRSGGERGYRSTSANADRLLCRYPPPVLNPEAWDRGVRVFQSGFRLATQPALAGIKHLNRLEQVLAARSWELGADESLVSDDGGRPISGTRSNLFWVSGGVLRTPLLDRCGVAGLMRQKVLTAAAALGIAAREAPGEWSDVEAAQEVFLTNSLIGLWPVNAMGAWEWPAPGPITQRLADRLQHPRLAA